MRKSLFALESADDMGVDAEMETGVEEGEVAGVMAEGADDMADIAETSDAVSEGTEAAAQMGKVEDLMEDAAVNGQGLDTVAAEAIRISVEAICARVGANPKSVYSLYATENFQSASSRKANTRIALEGVGQFLKDLWARIKASLKTLWEKVKAFFNKHISSLGRVKKALESAKAKVSASSGKFKAQASIEEAPASLVNMFAGKTAIGAPSIAKFIIAHDTACGVVSNMVQPGFIGISVSDGNFVLGTKPGTYDLGTATSPLIGGKYITVDFSDKDKQTNDEDGFNFEINREVVDKESKLSVSLADKAALSTLLTTTLKLITETIKFKEKYDKYSSDQNKAINAVDKVVSAKEATTPAVDGATQTDRNALSFWYKVNAKVPSLVTEMQGANISLAKGVLGYTALCLKNYK